MEKSRIYPDEEIDASSENEECFKIKLDDIKKRIDVFLAERLSMTRSAIQKLIESGEVLVNGKKASKSLKLEEGDTVTVKIPEPAASEIAPENIPLDIVYEDSDLLVVNKPKGMVVHPAPGNYSGTLVNALLYHCKDSLSGIGGVVRPGIVHRIDKDTSGLLIVAKNDAAHLSLSEQISTHSFLRAYEAIAVGNIKLDEREIEGAIGRHPVNRKKMAVVSGGKYALTKIKVLERFSGYSYVRCTLTTGRTHQIRVHMSSVGHPLLCDELYGGGKSDFEKKNAHILAGQCLHARMIGFVHPTTGENMYFESPLPEYFEKTLEKLRKRG